MVIEGTSAEVVTASVGEFIYCNCCQTNIPIDQKLEHYQSQWHRYNVKRKCAGMGPIPHAIFQSKITELQTQKDEKIAEDEAIYHCDISRKKFKSKAQLDQWQKSKKFKALVKKSENAPAPTPTPTTTTRPTAPKMDPSTPQPIPINQCLFDNRVFANYKENLNYMTQKYNFFIPYIEYLVSVQDLLTFCGFKVGMGHQCLYCDQNFSSVEAVKQHMVSSNHCKLNLDLDGEDYDELYDWTLPQQKQVPEGEMDLVDSDSDEKQQLAVVEEPKATVEDINDAGELVMTDGTVLGHRDLHKFYRQRPRPLEDQRSLVANMLAEYRRLKLPGYGPGKAAYNEKTKTVQRRRDKWLTNRGVKQNKLQTDRCDVKFIHG